MFDRFSERSRLIVFLTRINAGRRGAAALEPAHLPEAILREDQGEAPEVFFPGAMTSTGSPLRPPEHPFFTRQAASEILSAIEHLLPPPADPLEDSVDMQCSPALSETFADSTELADELHHNEVQPLHLVAAMLSGERTDIATVLTKAGLSREAAIAAIQR